jgi:hypothetical protein
MSPIFIMDRAPGMASHSYAGPLEYRLPDDRVSFWTGKHPTAGVVQAFMCAGCARIALYGCAANAEPGAAPDGSQVALS